MTIPDSYEFDFDGRQLAKGETCVEPVKSPHCPPQLCAGIYVAQETPSVAQVKRFLQVTRSTSLIMPGSPSFHLASVPFWLQNDHYHHIRCQMSSRTASAATPKPAHFRLDSPFTAIAETMYCDTLRPWYIGVVICLFVNATVR